MSGPSGRDFSREYSACCAACVYWLLAARRLLCASYTGAACNACNASCTPPRPRPPQPPLRLGPDSNLGTKHAKQVTCIKMVAREYSPICGGIYLQGRGVVPAPVLRRLSVLCISRFLFLLDSEVGGTCRHDAYYTCARQVRLYCKKKTRTRETPSVALFPAIMCTYARFRVLFFDRVICSFQKIELGNKKINGISKRYKGIISPVSYHTS